MLQIELMTNSIEHKYPVLSMKAQTHHRVGRPEELVRVIKGFEDGENDNEAISIGTYRN